MRSSRIIAALVSAFLFHAVGCRDDGGNPPLLDAAQDSAAPDSGSATGAPDGSVPPLPNDAGRDSAAENEPSLPPIYAVMYEVYGDTGGSDSYLSLLPSLDMKEVDITKARQFAGGRAFLATYNGWLFVGEPTTPIVTRYAVAADGTLREEGRLSFGNFGLTSGSLDKWTVTFISPTKAYLFDHKDATHIIWNPTTMEIRGEIKADPQFFRAELPDVESSPAVVRGNRMFRSVFWADYKTATYSTDHLLAVYDVESDKLLELVKETRCPAPGNLVHEDEAGNAYFSNWIWPIAGTLMRGAPKSCVLRLPAGSDRYDPNWTLSYAEVAGGREGAMFSYLLSGKALISIFHHERTSFDATTDPWKYAGNPVWQIWNLDLETKAVSPVEGIDFNAGAFTPVQFGARSFVMVPGKDWAETQVYEVKSGRATPAFKVRGWSYQFVQVR